VNPSVVCLWLTLPVLHYRHPSSRWPPLPTTQCSPLACPSRPRASVSSCRPQSWRVLSVWLASHSSTSQPCRSSQPSSSRSRVPYRYRSIVTPKYIYPLSILHAYCILDCLLCHWTFSYLF